MDTLDILISIRKIVRSINLESKRVQKDFGISIPQLLCLGHLERAPNRMSTHGELMKLLSLNSSTVTGIVNRLERKGMVKRLPKSGDKRVTYIGITPQGSKVVTQSPDVLHDQLTKKIKQLSPDVQKQIGDSLALIVEAMEIGKMDASPLITINDPIEAPEEPSEGAKFP